MSDLSVVIQSVEERKDDSGKDYTAYIVVVTKDGVTWTLVKRYSDFHTFHSKISAQCRDMDAPFPGKKFGKLDSQQTEERKRQIDAFFQELIGMILESYVKDQLDAFLELRQHSTLPSENKSTPDDFQPAPKDSRNFVDDDENEAKKKENMDWNDNWMVSDPLFGVLQANEDSSKPHQETKHTGRTMSTQSKSEVKPEHGNTSSSAPRFFVHSSAEDYPVSGSGLRDAIKNKDTEGAKRVLNKDPSLSNFIDQQGQSMLHLAAIFNQTETAITLVRCGARVDISNQENESPLDVALPTLRQKLLEVKREIENK
jgi:hypothetical protein